MTDTSFWKSGHRPTLIMAFLYFDVAFMVWNLLGPLAPIFSKALGLSPAEKGFVVAVPTLAGAVLRLVNGFLADRIGQKTTGIISQTIVILGLLTIWHFGVETMNGLIALGMVLGFAGAAFAVALPWPGAGIRPSIRARRWALLAWAIRARSSPRSSRRCWPRPSAGPMCWRWPPSPPCWCWPPS
jgi:NNP family nitrate/nitrite transporter-like MFS transporter